MCILEKLSGWDGIVVGYSRESDHCVSRSRAVNSVWARNLKPEGEWELNSVGRARGNSKVGKWARATFRIWISFSNSYIFPPRRDNPPEMKEIHNLVLRKTGNEPFGFRIIGGKDAGLSFKASTSIIHVSAHLHYNCGAEEHYSYGIKCENLEFKGKWYQKIL